MTRDEAISRARIIADEEGWTWREPVSAELETVGESETIFSDFVKRLSKSLGRRFQESGGRQVWQVFTNAGSRGVNVSIALDDETGEVLQKAFWPR